MHWSEWENKKSKNCDGDFSMGSLESIPEKNAGP